jgi:hypothetical protein
LAETAIPAEKRLNSNGAASDWPAARRIVVNIAKHKQTGWIYNKVGDLRGAGTMLRKSVYATLIVILMLGAVSAQTDKQGVPGYTDPLRTDLEKKNDREIDRAYQTTVKTLSDKEKKKSDPWGDVRPAPPATAKNKQ